MATKKLKTVEIHQMLDSAVLTVEDTATDPQASMALAQFEQYKDIVISMNGFVGVIPYHAVQYIKVTEVEGRYTRPDPYCEAFDIIDEIVN